MKWLKARGKIRILTMGVIALALAAIVSGCAPTNQAIQETAPKTGEEIKIFGFRPNWDLEDMVKRSDAVVIGALTANLGTKRKPGGDEEPPQYYDEYKDYDLSVERSLYPKEDFPNKIAVLVEAGPVANDSSITITGHDTPEFEVDERVLLFLESLQDDKFNEGVGRPVPKDHTKGTYYQAIIGAGFGKLSPDGDKWEDSRTGKSVSIDELQRAIERQKE